MRDKTSLGVKVAMLMMVKGGQRNLSQKVLAKLEWAEVEAGLKKNSQISDQAKAFGNLQNPHVQQIAETDFEKGYFDFKPEYRPGIFGDRNIRLFRPDIDARKRLGLLVAKSFDSDIVVLACLSTEKRNESFLQDLTLSSRISLNNIAMTLVFGKQWRTAMANLAVDIRMGDKTSIDEILGKSPKS